jgi:ADP-ribosylglycohydrolase
MRAAPIGLAAITEPDTMRRQAAVATAVIHAHPMAVVGAVAHAWLVASLACTTPGALDVDALLAGLTAMIDDIPDDGEQERSWERRPGKTDARVRLVDRFAEVPDWLDAPVERAIDHFYNGAFVLESSPMALWFFLRAPDDVEEVVIEAVMGGRDADTIASMAGAYAGAYLGDDAFPARWVGDDLEYRDDLVELADRLYDIGIGVGR